MFNIALDKTTRELFFLKADYRFTTRTYTPLEIGICHAWSFDGNICNKDEFLETFNSRTVNLESFQPVFPVGNPSEQRMHTIVPNLQKIITTAKDISSTLPVIPNPPYDGTRGLPHHYSYMNYLWNILTDTSIQLKSDFKSIVKDPKRIVGSKNFTAISLFGAYPCGLLIDELVESNNTYRTKLQMDELKNSDAITQCRRGLLPLLVPQSENHRILFAKMVVDLLFSDYTVMGQNPEIYSTNNILLFLGFLFSIKIKSNASIGPRNMLSLIDSIINFHNIPSRDLLLPYTAKITENCSLTDLSTNPDSDACALGGVGGVAHDGGGGKKLPSAPPTKESKPSAPPPKESKPKPSSKTSVTTSMGVSKKPIVKDSQATLSDALNTKVSTTKVPTTKVPKKMSTVPEKKPSKKPIVDIKADVIKAGRLQLLNPPSGPFKKFMENIHVAARDKGIEFNPKTCITGITRQDVFNIDKKYTDDPTYGKIYNQIGGGNNKNNNKTKSTNKISKSNNHTRKKKNSRPNKHKKYTSSYKYRKINPSSRSGSQSNRKKSKSKLSHKNVTFKRRRNNNK
jgi:hypothetical protein